MHALIHKGSAARRAIMVEITDINKLRPELLKQSEAELERKAAEIQMALMEKRRQKEIEEKEAIAKQANEHIDNIVAGVKFLHDNGILPQRIADAFKRGDGTFNPATFLRSVTADQLVPRAAKPRRSRGDGPVRRRRRRDPATGELVPSKRARAAGEV